ncbi:MAG: adenylate/guanylate cyclase domain-containing protein [Stellaceae bacterium]
MAQGQSEEIWRAIAMGEVPRARWGRLAFKFLPSNPRCKMCNAPFRGIGAPLMRLIGKRPARQNPRFCAFCERVTREHPGGAEVEMSLLFADVRGSTALAEHSSPTEFARLMNRFYNAATRVLIDTDALIDKLVGDEVVAHYLPGFAGPAHAKQAIMAARRLLAETGHGRPGGPWLPIGIGVHTGTAYFGNVGSRETFTDVTALGDAVNVTARLSSLAQGGEILASAAACDAAQLDLSGLERRKLDLKGHSQPIDAIVWHAEVAAA